MLPIVDQGSPEILFGEGGLFEGVPIVAGKLSEQDPKKWGEFIRYLENPIVVRVEGSSWGGPEESSEDSWTRYAIGLTRDSPDGPMVQFHCIDSRLERRIPVEDVCGLNVELIGRWLEELQEEPSIFYPEKLFFDLGELRTYGFRSSRRYRIRV